MITVAWDGSIYRTTSNYAYKPPEGAEFSPMDIMCEALGMCIAVSLVRLLEQDEITGEALRVEVEPFKAQAGSPRVEKFRVQVGSLFIWKSLIRRGCLPKPPESAPSAIRSNGAPRLNTK